jgi:hypothetical protein
MRSLCSAVLAALLLATSVAAQRRVRVGPIVSSISLQDAAGQSHSYSSFGALIDLLTADDGESGLSIARFNDLSSNACKRQLTFIGLESNYYPVGAKGIAPFASTELGLARVTESRAPLSNDCTGLLPPTVETTNQLGLAFGLGVRVGTNDAAATIEARFLQVPNSFVQGLEVRGNASIALGSLRKTELFQGTLGPALSVLIPVSGAMQGRGPLIGVRFRRDTKKAGSVGLQIDYAPLRITESCTNPGCEPHAILFAPGYEASLHPRWGRVYGELGLLLAGFYEQGPERGIAQGAHGGIGADIFAGARVMVNLNSRLLWMQRNNHENVFAVQVGASVSPRLSRAAGGH